MAYRAGMIHAAARHRLHAATAAALVVVLAACGGGQGSGPVATASSAGSPAPVIAPSVIHAAADELERLATGRYEVVTSIAGFPGLPDGPVIEQYGTYDLRKRRMQVGMVLVAQTLQALGSRALPPATRDDPHLLFAYSGDDIFLKGAGAARSGVKTWTRLSREQVEQVSGIPVDEQPGVRIPLLESLRTAAAPVERVASEGGALRYRFSVSESTALEVLNAGAVGRLLKQVPAETLERELTGQTPMEAVLDADGRLMEAMLDLAPTTRKLLKAAGGDIAKAEAQLPATFSSTYRIRFTDSGSPVSIHVPSKSELSPLPG